MDERIFASLTFCLMGPLRQFATNEKHEAHSHQSFKSWQVCAPYGGECPRELEVIDRAADAEVLPRPQILRNFPITTAR
jgi:hypothetical protein